MRVLKDRLLTEHPDALKLVQHFMDVHAEGYQGLEEVRLPKELFAAMMLVMLVGLEALDEEEPT